MLINTPRIELLIWSAPSCSHGIITDAVYQRVCEELSSGAILTEFMYSLCHIPVSDFGQLANLDFLHQDAVKIKYIYNTY